MEKNTLAVLRLITNEISCNSTQLISESIKVFPMSKLNDYRRKSRRLNSEIKNDKSFTRSKPYFKIQDNIVLSLSEEERDSFIIKNKKEIITAYSEYEKSLSSKESHKIKKIIVENYMTKSKEDELNEMLKRYQIVEHVDTLDEAVESLYRTEIIDIFKKLTNKNIVMLSLNGKVKMLQEI